MDAGVSSSQLAQARLTARPVWAPAWRLSALRLDPAVVIAGCVAFALVLCVPAVLNDPDTFWQIRTGEWILNHHAIPVIDPFSYTAGSRPWVPLEWLSETLVALAFRAGGMQAIVVLTAGVVGLTAALLMDFLRRFLPGPTALIALLVAFYNTEPSLLARPHLLCWPCLVLWVGGMGMARAKRTAPSFWLLPVMLLWANMHGSFILGLLLPGGFALEALWEAKDDRRRVFFEWARFIVAAWAVAALNPDFVSGEIYPLRLVQMPSLHWVTEWKPANFSRISPLEITLLGALAMGFSGKFKLPPMRLLMFLGMVHGALSHGRNDMILGLVGALVLAEPIGACLARGRAAALGVAWRRAAAVAGVAALAALAGRMLVPLPPQNSGAAFAAVLDHVPPALRARPVLNAYNYGGPLIFNGVRPFIDGRTDLYGNAFMDRFMKIISPNRAALQDAIAKYKIAWTMFPADAPVVQVLEQEKGWTRLVKADGMVIDVLQDQAR